MIRPSGKLCNVCSRLRNPACLCFLVYSVMCAWTSVAPAVFVDLVFLMLQIWDLL